MEQSVLIVDDLEHNRFLLEEALHGLAAKILTAAAGPEALDIVRSHRPDLVVLDFQMPGIDGAEVSSRIKSLAEVPFTYVVLLSGYHEAEVAEEVDHARADCFLGKPYRLEDVRRLVREGLRIAAERRGERSGGEGKRLL